MNLLSHYFLSEEIILIFYYIIQDYHSFLTKSFILSSNIESFIFILLIADSRIEFFSMRKALICI